MTKATADPCPRCLALVLDDVLDLEMVQPLPAGVGTAPLGPDGGPCCRDCQSADTVVRLGLVGVPKRADSSDKKTAFKMARIAVGNDRRESLRLPGVPLGLIMHGLVRASEPGDFDEHWQWLQDNDYFGKREEDDET